MPFQAADEGKTFKESPDDLIASWQWRIGLEG